VIKIIIKLRTTKYTEEEWTEKILKNNNDEFRINEIYSIRSKSGSTQIRTKIEHIPCGHIIDREAYGLMNHKSDIRCPICNLDNSKVSINEWENRIIKNDTDFKINKIYYKVRKDTGRNETHVEIEHIPCGTKFTRNASHVVKNKLKCPCCDNMMLVSYLHAVISIIFKNNYDGVEFEYNIGFKGEDGGVSKYDLYVPNYKGKPTLIEFQSRYHDEKADFDLKKKEFAINKGYNFIAIDHREYTIEEALNIFFGDIEINIENLDLSIFNKLDIITAQKLLNENKSYTEIEKLMGLGNGCINSAVRDGRLNPPENHVRVVRNIKSIVQLDMDGNYINTYKSSHEMENDLGYKVTIQSGNQCLHGYYWVEEEDYKNNNYEIPLFARNHCQTFVLIDENINIKETFKSLEDAKDYIKIKESRYIKNNLLHKQESVKGYKFMFLKEYNELYGKRLIN